jgi:glutathione peroxidase
MSQRIGFSKNLPKDFMTKIAYFIAAVLLISFYVLTKNNLTSEQIMNEPLRFIVKDINGNSKDLSDYKGKLVLIVNVASKCGLTPQYKGLQELYTKYSTSGFEILGFPSNDFLGQEPGTEAEIKEFCEINYKVSFPLFAKMKVKKGEGQSELYKYLTSKETNPGFEGEIEWNFQKFLISKEGKVIKRYSPQTSPSDIEKDILANLK